MRGRCRGTTGGRVGKVGEGCEGSDAAPFRGLVTAPRTLVVGAGIFGVTAALELRARGHDVTLVDQGRIPNPLAASTDVSKVIRLEYGPDEDLMALAERARAGWLRWNDVWTAEGGDPLFHETGVLMVSRAAMAPGGFEYESHRLLERRGHEPERLDARALAARFPAWSTGRYADGFYHRKGGWVESGRVVAALATWARARGVRVIEDRAVTGLVERGARVVGVRDASGASTAAEHVVVAAGSWTAQIVPELSSSIRPTGHPVVHLEPRDPEPFRAVRFPVFTADIANTGFYGFPLNDDGVVKIGNHGPGVSVDPSSPRLFAAEHLDRLRTFLEETFPALAGARVAHTRVCPYADSRDGDFWITRHPTLDGLVVASGGSGHGFKFAPVLGGLIADAAEGRAHPLLARFRWRPEVELERGREAARWKG